MCTAKSETLGGGRERGRKKASNDVWEVLQEKKRSAPDFILNYP